MLSTNTGTIRPWRNCCLGWVSSLGEDGYSGSLRGPWMRQLCPRDLGSAGAAGRHPGNITENNSLASASRISSPKDRLVCSLQSCLSKREWWEVKACLDGKSKHVYLPPNLQWLPSQSIFDSYSHINNQPRSPVPSHSLPVSPATCHFNPEAPLVSGMVRELKLKPCHLTPYLL